eukprot:TRINITY_DN28461_c0_g1_i1.p1 TRINITY_DN28461_c0_g1~~TRINITY_DN28461_c0_g1_i1.p1  ORF type:complete len:743 (-),score=86.90 TRINITY_DN28461_c0_g1_i1:345-2573(-)
MREQVQSLFKQIDANGDGFIDTNDLAAEVQKLDPSFDADFCDGLFLRIDTDGDGRISFDEFFGWISVDDGLDPGLKASLRSGLAHSVDRRVWTRRERLTLENLSPGQRYSLPLLLHNDASNCILTDVGGLQRSIPLYLDTVYKAVDHRLFWIGHQDVLRSDASIILYSNPEDEHEQDFKDVSAASPEAIPEQVVALADFFQGGVDSVLARWTLNSEKDFERARHWVSTEPLEELRGSGLRVDTARSYMAFSRSLSTLAHSGTQRVYARAHFYDDGSASLAHWFGYESHFGSAAVGCAFGIESCYSFLNGRIPKGQSKEYAGWQRTLIERSKGWHLFELEFDGFTTCFTIDGEQVAKFECEGCTEGETVWLISRCGGDGVWAGVEVFHAPCSLNAWSAEVHNVTPMSRPPWNIKAENGRWQANDIGVVKPLVIRTGAIARVTPIKRRLMESFDVPSVPSKYTYDPKLDCMLGGEYEVIAISREGMCGVASLEGSDGGLWWLPPLVLKVVKDAPEDANESKSHDVEDTESPSSSQAIPVATASHATVDQASSETACATPPVAGICGLAIDCWSIPGEEDRERLDRCLTAFLTALEAAKVQLPGNISRVGDCSDKQHRGCSVFSFGTRRVHLTTRVTESGRILLVVRCGGGYLDFVEFARRHGSLESLRLERMSNGRGRDVVKFTSVLSRGKVRAVAGSRQPSPHATSRTSSPGVSSRRVPSPNAAIVHASVNRSPWPRVLPPIA